MNNMEIVKKYIADLENDENRKQFAKELYNVHYYRNTHIAIYYDFEYHGIYCDALVPGVHIQNIVYLMELIPHYNFKKMSEKNFDEYVDNIIEDLQTIFNEKEEL